MKALIKNLKEYFGSKKTKAAIKGCLAVLLAQYLELPTETALAIAGIVMAQIYGIAKKDVAEIQNKKVE